MEKSKGIKKERATVDKPGRCPIFIEKTGTTEVRRRGDILGHIFFNEEMGDFVWEQESDVAIPFSEMIDIVKEMKEKKKERVGYF